MCNLVIVHEPLRALDRQTERQTAERRLSQPKSKLLFCLNEKWQIYIAKYIAKRPVKSGVALT